LAGGVNLYSYILNNPINGIDKYGLMGAREAIDYLRRTEKTKQKVQKAMELRDRLVELAEMEERAYQLLKQGLKDCLYNKVIETIRYEEKEIKLEIRRLGLETVINELPNTLKVPKTIQ